MFVEMQQVLIVTSDPSPVLILSSVPKLSQTATKQSVKSNKTLQWLKWVDLKGNWTRGGFSQYLSHNSVFTFKQASGGLLFTIHALFINSLFLAVTVLTGEAHAEFTATTSHWVLVAPQTLSIWIQRCILSSRQSMYSDYFYCRQW